MSVTKINLYLDVDGVILDKHLQPSGCLHKFISYIIEHYQCYWLTTHVTDGTTEHLWSYLRRNQIQEETLLLMEKIKGTSWDMLKTDGIDFSQHFLWFDDMPTTGEIETLKSHSAEDSLIWIDRAKGDGLCNWLTENIGSDNQKKIYDKH